MLILLGFLKPISDMGADLGARQIRSASYISHCRKWCRNRWLIPWWAKQKISRIPEFFSKNSLQVVWLQLFNHHHTKKNFVSFWAMKSKVSPSQKPTSRIIAQNVFLQHICIMLYNMFFSYSVCLINIWSIMWHKVSFPVPNMVRYFWQYFQKYFGD